MKHINFVMIVVSIGFTLSSCMGLNSTSYSNNPVSTTVNIRENNFKIVKQVEGEWTARYVFGIGGFSKKALTTNAIGEMYKNANLTGSQQIINITTTTSFKMIVGPIYMQRTVIARGFVIEFTGPLNRSTYLPQQNEENLKPSDSEKEIMKDNIATDSIKDLKQNSKVISKTKTSNHIKINPKWYKFVKKIANKYNDGETFDPIYDLNDDGKITFDELDHINQLYRYAYQNTNPEQVLHTLILDEKKKGRRLND